MSWALPDALREPVTSSLGRETWNRARAGKTIAGAAYFPARCRGLLAAGAEAPDK
jgi:hypothetical protein